MLIDYELDKTTIDGMDYSSPITLNIVPASGPGTCEVEYITPGGESRWYTVEGTFDGTFKDDCEPLEELSSSELEAVIAKMRGDA